MSRASARVLLAVALLSSASLAGAPSRAETSTPGLAAAARLAGQGGKEWLAYEIETASDRHFVCCHTARGGTKACTPERDRGSSWTTSDGWRGAPRTGLLRVYLEVDGGQVRRVRNYSVGCAVEVTWPLRELEGVEEAESLTFLSRLALHPPDSIDDRRERFGDEVLATMARHRRPAEALLRVLRESKDRDLQRQALFWMAQSGDPQALDLIARLLDS